MIIAGFVIYPVMWIFLVLALLAWGRALDHAEVAIHGDITGVRNELRRAFELARTGMPIGLLGYLLFLIGAIQGKARAGWIYRGGWLLSISYLVVFPVGTILAVCGIVHLRGHKEEYLRPARPPELP